MRDVKIACLQLACGGTRDENTEKAFSMAEAAAGEGADIIAFPELFERRYFCQERNYNFYSYAEEPEKNLAIRRAISFTKAHLCALIVSFYEKDKTTLYNSVCVVEGGKILGTYRKTHIPDDHCYQEKFYFTPGNTGFKVFKTKKCSLGIGICWDQWFPEVARCLALGGAEIIFYPTAIGSEPILCTDSKAHWQRVMQGHAAANLVPVAAANRTGKEDVYPTKENGGQSSSLVFYGSSFITSNTGEIICEASRDKEEILFASFDMDELEKDRLDWGLFRDRRPGCYKGITNG